MEFNEREFLQKRLDRHLQQFVSMMGEFHKTRDTSFWHLAYCHMDRADELAQEMYAKGLRETSINLYPEGWDAVPMAPAPEVKHGLLARILG